ncbi:hypothetical protein TVAG_020840 [Trichomonas vaginalis G3]|nr:organellar and viral DNA polymerase type B [Trichomonas vaginalis G3]XP_051076257.1 organellar and viral DNA polymerase type B [Trichomonas vaginalis G3]EAX79637.1 hypothetical protein TVAG_386620 [Trichomonas vaginalis G3]EAX86874.1 hypothetical protein TVAG_020840 [Trichomonas vaginalis G3]KAI5482302.1 organellar and viral DNA polymerase type B [Trichomonas vaginalis G3]KAI5482884.1 organellar and viral DNA polymerase type B [Trichomonas vaginalis G3]|eukprot:XP_001292567.1 hypothetical protein [Trichomonas vaginalis G3]
MKGITQDVIALTANQMFPDAIQVHYDEKKGLFFPEKVGEKYSIVELYKSLYEGDEITFDLCIGSKPCFNKNKDFTISTKSSFERKLKF